MVYPLTQRRPEPVFAPDRGASTGAGSSFGGGDPGGSASRASLVGPAGRGGTLSLAGLGADHGPENMTRLRRFAVSLITAESNESVAATIDKLARRVHLVFEAFCMTDNGKPRIGLPAAAVG